MTIDEFDLLAGVVTAMWPGQGWPDATITVAAPLFADVEYADAEKAVAKMVRGREFPPPPGLVLERAELIAEARHRLVDSERLRLASPDEQAAVSRRWPEIRAAIDRLADRHALPGSNR